MPSTKLKTTPEYSWKFTAIGTAWEIVSLSPLSNKTIQRIEEIIEAFDSTYSRFRPDSLISKMAKHPGEYEFPKSAVELFNFYDDLWEITEHQVTPVIGDVLISAGYDDTYSLKPQKTIRKAHNYAEVLQRKGAHLSTTEKTVIDIGAVGKGYLIDEITRLLRVDGHISFTVDGSGDVRVIGMSETIGLENPFDTTQIVGTVMLANKALCASASNRRAWGDWHHIINPVTNEPVRDIVATWVIADSAMIADGLATALYFVEPQALAERYTYEYLRIHADGSAEYSNDFKKGIF